MVCYCIHVIKYTIGVKEMKIMFGARVDTNLIKDFKKEYIYKLRETYYKELSPKGNI
jgi:hypothetical protein